jgi:hypothetical protein
MSDALAKECTARWRPGPADLDVALQFVNYR